MASKTGVSAALSVRFLGRNLPRAAIYLLGNLAVAAAFFLLMQQVESAQHTQMMDVYWGNNFVDFSKPAARSWFWEHMVPAYKSGIQYFWNDEADSIGNAQFPNFQNADMQRAMYEGARAAGNIRYFP